MGSHSYQEDMEKKNNDFFVIAIVSFIFCLIVGISLFIKEEEIAALTGRLFQ